MLNIGIFIRYDTWVGQALVAVSYGIAFGHYGSLCHVEILVRL